MHTKDAKIYNSQVPCNKLIQAIIIIRNTRTALHLGKDKQVDTFVVFIILPRGIRFSVLHLMLLFL